MRIILTGGGGLLGTYIRDELGSSAHSVEAWGRSPDSGQHPIPLHSVDLCDHSTVSERLTGFGPDVILHLAAISKPAQVLADPATAWQVNVEGTRTLCDWCRESGCRLVFTSTDMVFDGRHAPYREDAQPSPSNEYGRTKAKGERLVQSVPTGLVARIPLLYGPMRCNRPSFYDHSLTALRSGKPQLFFEDEFRTPLDLLTAARLLIGLSEIQAAGIVHLGGPERLSRLELMSRVADVLGIESRLLGGNRLADHPGPEPRPANTSMVSERIRSLVPHLRMPTVEAAVVAMTAAKHGSPFPMA